MNSLKLYTEPTTGNAVDVYWTIGINTSGVIRTAMEAESEAMEVIAELAAIRHLLFEVEVFGLATSGSGIVLELSKGATRKTILGKSKHKDAIRYGAFLDFIKDGMTIKTGSWKPSEDIKTAAQENRIDLDIEPGIHGVSGCFIESPFLGRVLITRHALERFEERTIAESGLCKNPFSSLAKRLSNNEMKQIALPKTVQKHKIKKYGAEDHFEVWKHPTSTLNFGIVDDPDAPAKVLVTVFVRNF